MSRKLTITACLIMRDAASDLDWCLESLAGEVDELVIVDTGSHDASKTIARRYAGHVYHFAWCDDFSAARNFALSKAHGTWVFFPDSDECLAGERGALRRAVQGAEGLGERALSILRREVDEQGRPVRWPDNPAVRLLRRGGGLAYCDAVHEVLRYPDGSAPDAPLVPADELFLWHRGYAPSRKPAKMARNRAILERLERDGIGKTYLHYYLAGVYTDAGRHEDVCREAELSLAAGEHPATGALDLWRNYEAAVEALGDTERLQELCERAVREAPQLPDTYARLAVMAMNRGDFAEGERMLLEARQREEDFPMACPDEYDTFREALPQVEHLLEECRRQIVERVAQEDQEEQAAKVPTSADGGAKEKEERMAEKKRVQVTLPQVPQVSAEQQAAEQLADLLPASAKTIVLFGSGSGAAGQIFLRRAPFARVFGFVPSRAEAQAAGQMLTGAFVGTPGTADLGMYGLSDADCIAFAPSSCDGLTKDVLLRHASALSADGQMVFAVENPTYLGRMLLALGGKPAERPTCAPLWISQVLREAGFGCVYVTPLVSEADEARRKNEAARALADRMRAFVKEEGGSVKLDPFVSTYLVRAGRAKQPTMFLHAFIGEEIVTARVRVWEPDTFLAAEPGILARSSKNSMEASLGRQMDSCVVIRQRQGFTDAGEAARVTKRLRADGDVLVYELDDNPCRFYEPGDMRTSMDFAGVHAVQVSTEALAEVIRPYNPHVVVFENQLKELPEPRDYASEEADHGDRVTIFFGALNREEDYDDIMPVLNDAAEKYGDRLFFRVLADVHFYQALKTQQKEFIADPKLYDGKFVPYEAYQRVLHSSDIALLPLHDTEFNRTKSDLKFIESAGHGTAVLASPTVYERTVVDGCTGCIYRSTEEFAAKLKRLVEDKAWRHAIARAAYNYVKENRLLSQHYRERLAAYREMVAHRAELDRELEERLRKIGQLQ